MHVFTSANSPVTAEQFALLADNSLRELVKGEILETSPTGRAHADLESVLDGLLGTHVRRNKLGKLLVGEAGFILSRNPDTVRAADLAFISAARLSEVLARSIRVGAPDLAVEIPSPSQTQSYFDDKVADWLSAGAKMVWVVSPSGRRSPSTARPLTSAR